jgi:hypothetical protein
MAQETTYAEVADRLVEELVYSNNNKRGSSTDGTVINNNNNNNNNNPYFSLSVLSTVSGTGAAATGIIVTVPGVLRTRNQSKCLSTYLLKIHRKYDELGKRTESVDKVEYLDFLEGLRSDIIYLLHRREINEYQYKMLDDRIIEHLNKINTRMNYPSR